MATQPTVIIGRDHGYDRAVVWPEIPKWNQMFGPTIKALQALGGSGAIQEINEKAIELEGYTDGTCLAGSTTSNTWSCRKVDLPA